MEPRPASPTPPFPAAVPFGVSVGPPPPPPLVQPPGGIYYRGPQKAQQMDPRAQGTGSWTDMWVPGPGTGYQQRGLASALPSTGEVVAQCMKTDREQALSDLIGGTPKQYKLPTLPDWFLRLNAECFEHVRSFLDFEQKLVVCQVSKAWNKPMQVKVWRTGYGKNRLRYSLPAPGCISYILREPATEKQRLLQAVVKIQRYWINRALSPVFHFDPHMCRGNEFGIHDRKPKEQLLALHFGYLRRSKKYPVCNTWFECCGFDKLGLRTLVSTCIEEYFHDPWREDDDADEDADPVSQYWINKVEHICPSSADGAELDKPQLQRFLLHRLWCCVNQPGRYTRQAGYITFGRIRAGSSDGSIVTREDMEITLRLRGRRTTYNKNLGMGTKWSGLSVRHRPGGSRRDELFYAGHGGWLYAPIKYVYSTGKFALDRRLRDYDPATDSFTRCFFGPVGSFTGDATWIYSYLEAHEHEVHLKSGSWVVTAAACSYSTQTGWGGYDQDLPKPSRLLAPYKWPRVALKVQSLSGGSQLM